MPKTNRKPQAPPVRVQPVVQARWDIDHTTGEPMEWRLVAKEDIEGAEWTFPKYTRLRGFIDLQSGNWCVYTPGDYFSSRIFGVPENLLEIVRPVKRLNNKVSRPAAEL